MSILYLTYDGLTDPLGGSQILPYLTELAGQGYKIEIISFEKKAAFEIGYDRIQKLTTLNGIQWTFFTYTKSPAVLSTIFDLIRLRSLVRKRLRQTPETILHCRSYLTALIGLEMKQKHGTKFIFDMRGFWADERVEGGLWNLNNPVYRLVYKYFKKKERHFFLHANHTISLTSNALDYIRNQDGCSAISASVIPCCVDTNLFTPRIEKINAKFTIVYIGSLGTWYMLSEMMQFFKVVLSVKPDAIFKFITLDSGDLIIAEAKKQKIKSNHLKITRADRNEVPEELSEADMAVFFIRPGFSKRASSATKLGELMSMGIPIIANKEIGDQNTIFEENEIGYLISDFNDVEYQKAINYFLYNQFNQEKIRKAAVDLFGLSVGVRRYSEIYKSMER